MTDFETADFFTDESLIADPYPFFDHLRSRCPVAPTTSLHVLAVTGHDEAVAVYKSPDFSSCVSVAGPFSGMPIRAGDSDDVTTLIEQHREVVPMAEHITSQDPPLHTRTRNLLSRLITPKRLKENEQIIWQRVDEQLDTFIDTGKGEFIADYAKPFSLLVIADLLGVPREDHDDLKSAFALKTLGELGSQTPTSHHPMQWLDDSFRGYIADRRRDPRDDVLTELAHAKHEDGSTPDIADVVNLSTFLFAAGMETTTKLLSSAIRFMADTAGCEAMLRDDRRKITAFLEETLRIESPVKAHFRMARVSTTIGDVDVPAGTTVMLLPGACNRDPRKFDNPRQFRMDRPNVREHLAFVRGAHSCPGAPLARSEGRISINRILDRMSNITISEQHHGPADARHYDYEPTFIMRGLTELHIDFDPVG